MKKLIIALIGVVDALLLGVIIFSVVTGWRFGEDLPFFKQSVPTAKTSSVASRTLTSSEPEETQGQTTQPETEEETESTAPKKQTTSKTEKSAKKKTTKKTSSTKSKAKKSTTKKTAKKTSKAKSKFPKASKLSTKKNIKISEAERFNAVKGKWRKLSAKKIKINKFSAIKGGWKAYMVTDPKNKRDSYREDYMNIKISGSAKKATVTFRWNTYVNGKKVKTKNTKFTGKWKNNKIIAKGEGKVTLKAFYLDGKKEYATGTYMWPDGVKANIGLKRK